MKLSFRDRIILVITVLLLAGFMVYRFIWVPGLAKTVELEEKKHELESLAVDITPLLEQTENLSKQEQHLLQQVNELKESKNSAAMTKESFLIFLGDAAEKNTVGVLRFNDLGIKAENGVWKAAYDFELKGTATEINQVLSDLDGLGVKYSVGSVSYRQMMDLPYLKRYFDNFTNLPWYQIPELEESTEPTVGPEEEPDIALEEFPEFPSQPFIEPPSTLPGPAPASEPSPAPTPLLEEYDTITDRLNKLLEQTSYNAGYKTLLLTSAPPYPTFDYDNEMRLAVTIQLIMCREPTVLDGVPKGEV